MSAANTRAVILGCQGLRLTKLEASFFAEAQPWGFILFDRNIQNADQLRGLTEALRATVGWDAPIFIDQEGGRVSRLKPPLARCYPPALDQSEHLGEHATRAMWLRARLIAAELRALGIDGNCTPLADIATPQTHSILRNRTYGTTAKAVSAVARANADGTLAGGVLPVLKHIPGHGKATVDSHIALPHVSATLAQLESADFAPFRDLNDLPLGMTAHVVYEALDRNAPATTSADVIKYVRQNIGFTGLLMTDDLSMQALSGTLAERTQASLKAGCDLILHCNGRQEDMHEIISHVPVLSQAQRHKAEAALRLRTSQEADLSALTAEYDAMIKGI